MPRHFARANQADRCITLLHCAQRLTPWLLDTRGCERKVECFSLFERYVTLPVGTWLIALDQSFRSHYNRLLRTSQSTTSSFGGKETNFFGSKFAIDSSTPLSTGLLLLYLTFKSMPKAKFWRCQYCRVRSRRRCQNSTSGPTPQSLRSTKIRAWLPWPTTRPETFCGVLATLVDWTARVSRSIELSIGCVRRPNGCVRRPNGCVRRPNERSIFSFQTIVDFVLILLGHALGLDHHAALLIFCANVLKQAKTGGFFWQRELRKTDTAREVCVGMAA